MLTLQEMKNIRVKKGVSYEEIAKLSGVSISSVQKLFGSDNANPRRTTLEKLNKAFDAIDAYLYASYNTSDTEFKEDVASDITPQYNLYGHGKMVSGGNEPIVANSGYTYEDYLDLDLPEGKRVEVIDGIIYDMASPTDTHQAIIGYIFNHLTNEFMKRQMKCMTFCAPIDIRLDFSDGPTTVVQPDIVVRCSKDFDEKEEQEEVTKSNTDDGTNKTKWLPRFVIEVLSPSTRGKDMFIKTPKYRGAGIDEYWIIDDKKQQVIKHNFIDDTTEIFGYEDKIGIDVFHGDIKIDMKDLQNYLELYADAIYS